MNSYQDDITYVSEELRYLLRDADYKLSLFLKEITKNKKHIYSNTYKQSLLLAEQYQKEIKYITQQLNSLHTHEALQITTIIENIREYIRSHQVLFGALITNTDWQSPSSDSSTFSQAGRQTGKIYATINDYKRDQHWDAYSYEQAFIKEYIDAFFKLSVRAYTTSSGMSAFTTILLFLIGEKKTKGPILCGASSYFQNRWLLEHSFGEQIKYVDESNTAAVIQAIDRYAPSVIFLDSLTNAPTIVTPDILTVIQHLKKVKKEVHLVIDNTGLSIQLQPIPLLLGSPHIRLCMFESLNKFHQFGMDRVSGGIIIGYGKGIDKLFDYRVHSGTIISDSVVTALPTPNRKLLIRRLTRHQKNTKHFVDALRTWITSHPDSALKEISYPNKGAYCALQFKPKYNTVPSFKKFVSLALRIAKLNNVSLVSGTSFGLNTTRIYLTAMRSTPHTPFVRIAIGTEDEKTLTQLEHVFTQTLIHFH